MKRGTDDSEDSAMEEDPHATETKEAPVWEARGACECEFVQEVSGDGHGKGGRR